MTSAPPPRPVAAVLLPLLLPSLLPSLLPGAQDPRGERPGSAAGPAEPSPAQVLELSLEEAVGLALGNDLSLQRAEIQTEIASFERLGSWGSFDWVFDASATVLDQTSEGSSFLSGGDEVNTDTTSYDFSFRKPVTTGGSFSMAWSSSFTDTNNIFTNDPRQAADTLSLSYTQPLLRGAWSQYATSLQREQEVVLRRQIEDQRQTRQVVGFNVEVSYWDLVSAMELRAVADSAVDLAQSQLEQEQRELDAGVGTEVDVVQARAELATRIEGQIQGVNDVAQRMDDLRKMLFASGDEDLWELEIIPSTGLPEQVSIADLPHWTSAKMTALELRPELRQARLDVDIANIQLTRAMSEVLSGLDLELSVRTGAVDKSGSEALQETVGFDFPTYSATLTYTLPLGNRSARYGERAARAAYRSAKIDYEQTEVNVVAEVRAAVRAVEFAAEQVSATAESLTLARRQLEAEQARYAEGLSTTFQVLEFQQDLIEALSNEANARAGFVKAQAELERAQGLIGEPPR